jgi:hypothetical protein
MWMQCKDEPWDITDRILTDKYKEKHEFHIWQIILQSKIDRKDPKVTWFLKHQDLALVKLYASDFGHLVSTHKRRSRKGVVFIELVKLFIFLFGFDCY